MVTTKFNLKKNWKLKPNSLVIPGLLLCAVFTQQAQAQTKIGGAASAISSSAFLQLGDSAASVQKGLLLPRVALTSSGTFGLTNNTPVQGLHVYNVNTQNDVTPGEYYWNGTKWMRLNDSAWTLNGNAGTTAAVYNPSSGLLNGNFIGTTDNQDLVLARNGTQAGRVDNNNNTALGVLDLVYNTTGGMNTAVGSSALRSNTSGGWNTSVGAYALWFNNTGNYNTAVGSYALAIALGTGNTAIGALALNTNTNGVGNFNFNTAIGYGRLSKLQTGSYNIGIGYMDTSAVGPNMNGNYNILIGARDTVANRNGNYQLNIGSVIWGNGLDSMNGATPVPNVGKIGINISKPNATLTVNGSISANIRTTGAGISASQTDYCIVATATVTVTLLAPATAGKGMILIIRANNGAVTVSGIQNGGTSSTSTTLTSGTVGQYMCDGSSWWKIN